MKAKAYKRLGAFIIDLIVIMLFFMLIYYFVDKSDKLTEIEKNISNINEQLINESISYNEYLKEFGKNIYELDKENINYTGFNILIIIFYFVIIPIITKGYTLGMYISSIKIKGKLTIKNMFLRNLIATGLLYLLLSFALTSIMNNETYFLVITILALIQILLVIISAFMIIYRHDRRGIQDIISGTEIVQTKEVKQ